MIDLTGYIDKWGMIVLRNGDGGDSSAWTGREAFLRIMDGETPDVLNFVCRLRIHTIGFGKYRRHPDPTKWYSNSANFTRDQYQPLLAGMAAYGMWREILCAMLRRILRAGFYQNISPDYVMTGPWKVPDWSGFSYDIRALLFSIRTSKLFYPICALLYPIFIFTDVLNIIGAISIVVEAKRDPTFSDDSNFLFSQILQEVVCPTACSITAKYIYLRYRPGGPEFAINDYYNPRNNSVPMADTFLSVVNKYLRGQK